MKEAKKFTCLKDRGVKVDGAPEGTKKSVLAWMKKFYFGLRKVPDQDMMPAWQFFYRGEIITYETAEGQKVYLAEVKEDSESLSTEGEIDPVDEKNRETVLKNYKRTYAKNHPVWAKKAAEDAKALDEEVAAEVAMDIWKTAHLTPRKQKEKLAGKYAFGWLIPSDSWMVSDIASSLLHDELLTKRDWCADYFRKDDELCTRICEGKFIHLQMTRAFDGGMDAYIVFRTPKTRDATIIRVCAGK